MAAAFSLYPTRMEDLMAVADADEVMPPKSTWFDPKLADGLRSGKFLVENADEDCTGRCAYRTTCRVNQLRPVASSLHKIGDILM